MGLTPKWKFLFPKCGTAVLGWSRGYTGKGMSCSSSDFGIDTWFGKIAYHAMNQEKADRPCWSIIFGGDSYMILFLTYITDANDKQRIAIFCSGILSTYHDDNGPNVDAARKLPVCSAIVYMLLSTCNAAAKASLKEELHVRIQHPFPALPGGLGRLEDGRKYSKRIQPVCYSQTASSDATDSVLARITGWRARSWFHSPNTFTHWIHYATKSRYESSAYFS